MVRIRSLHAPVHVTNIDALSHKLFQIFEYGTFYGAFWSLLSHRMVPPKNLLGAPQHNVTFLSGAFGKHEHPSAHIYQCTA
jgi:hypothetical protein